MELRNPIKRSEEILVESLRRRRMEFGKFGVVLEIEDSVLACLVALGILLVFNCKQMSFIFPNI